MRRYYYYYHYWPLTPLLYFEALIRRRCLQPITKSVSLRCPLLQAHLEVWVPGSGAMTFTYGWDSERKTRAKLCWHHERITENKPRHSSDIHFFFSRVGWLHMRGASALKRWNSKLLARWMFPGHKRTADVDVIRIDCRKGRGQRPTLIARLKVLHLHNFRFLTKSAEELPAWKEFGDVSYKEKISHCELGK